MNNSIQIHEGTLSSSLPLLLLQVLNLTQISPEVNLRAKQLQLTNSIEVVRKQISEAIRFKQPVWKRNEQLVQSNDRLLQLISDEVQWYADARLRTRELLEFVSKLESNPTTKRDTSKALSDLTNGTEYKNRLDISLNYTVDEHPINNFHPLSPDDVEVMLHPFLPHNSGNENGIKDTNEDRRAEPRDDIVDYEKRPKFPNSSTSTRHKRVAKSSLMNILISMYNYTGESETVKGEISTLEPVTSHPSILELERNPLRRNEQLQNLNLQLQKLVLEVIQDHREELLENRQLQQKLVKLLIGRYKNEEMQKDLCGNPTINLQNLQNKVQNNENVIEENNELNHQLEPLGSGNVTKQEQTYSTYPEVNKELLEVSKSGNLSAVLFLISINANVSTHDEDNLTPLHWAAKNSHLELAHILLEAGANPNARDIDGNTPLHLAAESAVSEMIQLLINYSDTLELKNSEGNSPIHVAIHSGNTEAALELIKLGSNLTSRNNEDRTPLHLAAATGKEEVAQILVDSGGEVNAQSGNGYSPLHLAALHGHVGLCRLLLDGGADVNVLTSERQTPLHLAVLSGNFPTVEVLVQRGAKTKERNSKGRTPSGIAARKGNKRIVTFLGQH